MTPAPSRIRPQTPVCRLKSHSIPRRRERKFSSPLLNLERLDYPDTDEEELNNYLVMYEDGDGIKFERLPVRFWGNMKEQYEAHNKDYTGVYRKN